MNWPYQAPFISIFHPQQKWKVGGELLQVLLSFPLMWASYFKQKVQGFCGKSNKRTKISRVHFPMNPSPFSVQWQWEHNVLSHSWLLCLTWPYAALSPFSPRFHAKFDTCTTSLKISFETANFYINLQDMKKRGLKPLTWLWSLACYWFSI